MTTTELPYIGTELDLFSNANNWKSYFARHLKPFVSGYVAEVGAGIGGTTALLCSGDETSWTCLEPDPSLCQEITDKIADEELPANVTAEVATLADLAPARTFDSIMYIDVLEHIEDDLGEANRAADRLNPGGYLIVLSPAHQWLFTPFDEAIGHYRRYNKSSIKALKPAGVALHKCFYLDSVGLLASLGNKLLLRQSSPTLSQIKFWDNMMVPVSGVADPLTRHMFGKTIVAVWQKPTA